MDEELNEWVELNQVARAAVTHGWLWGMGAWENRRGYSALGRGIGGQRQADPRYPSLPARGPLCLPQASLNAEAALHSLINNL